MNIIELSVMASESATVGAILFAPIFNEKLDAGFILDRVAIVFDVIPKVEVGFGIYSSENAAMANLGERFASCGVSYVEDSWALNRTTVILEVPLLLINEGSFFRFDAPGLGASIRMIGKYTVVTETQAALASFGGFVEPTVTVV